MGVCSKCGIETVEGAKFCDNCGAVLCPTGQGMMPENSTMLHDADGITVEEKLQQKEPAGARVMEPEGQPAEKKAKSIPWRGFISLILAVVGFFPASKLLCVVISFEAFLTGVKSLFKRERWKGIAFIGVFLSLFTMCSIFYRWTQLMTVSYEDIYQECVEEMQPLYEQFEKELALLDEDSETDYSSYQELFSKTIDDLTEVGAAGMEKMANRAIQLPFEEIQYTEWSTKLSSKLISYAIDVENGCLEKMVSRMMDDTEAVVLQIQQKYEDAFKEYVDEYNKQMEDLLKDYIAQMN